VGGTSRKELNKAVKTSRRKFLVGSGVAALGIVATLAAYREKVPFFKGPSFSTSSTQESSQTENVTFHVETFVENLEIPWSLEFAPDHRIFFTERMGRINVITPDSSKPRLFAQVPIASFGEGGLLGLALSPAFESDHHVYVYHTYRSDINVWNRVVRYLDKDGVGVDPKVIVDNIPGGNIHDGGRIKFGADGKLYVGTGESGDRTLAQNLRSLGGKILRANSDGSIPNDNPFPNSLVYSYGHRNVQGIAWHPLSKRLYETEHGPTGENGWFANDEVNLIEPSKNYGWPTVFCKANDPRFVDPIFCTGDSETWAPSGCTFYNPEKSGSRTLFQEWAYSFFVATLRGEHLHRFFFNHQTGVIEANEKLFQGAFGRLRDVVQGPDGLYILTSNGDGGGSPAPNDDRILKVTAAK